MKVKKSQKDSLGGRPPKLNDDLIKRICNNLMLGMYVETAVVMEGIQKSIFYEWCNQAHKKPNSIYKRFLDAVQTAQAKAEARDLLNIDKCAMGREWEYERDEKGNLIFNSRGNPIPKRLGVAPDWHASAWRLERRAGSKWNKPEKVEQTGADGGPQIVVTIPSNGREVIKEKSE